MKDDEAASSAAAGSSNPVAKVAAVPAAAAPPKTNIMPTSVAKKTNQKAAAKVNDNAAATKPASIPPVVVPPLVISSSRPSKRQRIELTPPSYAELKGDVNNLLQSLKANPDGGGDIRNNAVFSVGYYVDQLYAHITEIKRWGDDIVRFKDKQYRDATLIRIPKAFTDESFRTSSKTWIPHALNINGNGDVENATRRVIKYFVKHNKDVVLAALDEDGTNVLKPMSEAQVVAMMKDGKVRTFDERKKIMKHLRDHCGKEFLPSIRKMEALVKKTKEEEEEAAKKEESLSDEKRSN
ncbi:hypothetical protein QTG54_006268 [Skeletonema marinoi]|uniref:Uncharacterized protein n=1 Tax=Skeletonema marinoi TaxID=267567 RepID=A0AAD8YA62_9STRA|nr:hypothetical protein QTG54_006268 [Skeletonema marinoi]